MKCFYDTQEQELYKLLILNIKNDDIGVLAKKLGYPKENQLQNILDKLKNAKSIFTFFRYAYF